MNITLFKPTFCFSDELKSSWSKNILTKPYSKTAFSSRIPIKHVGVEACLSLEHDSDSNSNYIAAMVAMDSKWSAVDLTSYKQLRFTMYTDRNYKLQLFMKDGYDTDSSRVIIQNDDIDGPTREDLFIDISEFFKNTKCNQSKIKNIGFIGGEKESYYISSLVIHENEEDDY